MPLPNAIEAPEHWRNLARRDGDGVTLRRGHVEMATIPNLGEGFMGEAAQRGLRFSRLAMLALRAMFIRVREPQTIRATLRVTWQVVINEHLAHKAELQAHIFYFHQSDG